jgi:hypothetical protein
MDMGLIGVLGGVSSQQGAEGPLHSARVSTKWPCVQDAPYFLDLEKRLLQEKRRGFFRISWDDFGLVVGVRGSWVRDIDIFKISGFQWLILFLGELNCRGAM